MNNHSNEIQNVGPIFVRLEFEKKTFKKNMKIYNIKRTKTFTMIV